MKKKTTFTMQDVLDGKVTTNGKLIEQPIDDSPDIPPQPEAPVDPKPEVEPPIPTVPEPTPETVRDDEPTA